MKFKERNRYRQLCIDETELVQAIVSSTSSRGELESLAEKIETLTEIVGYMASMMDAHQLAQLANLFGWETET